MFRLDRIESADLTEQHFVPDATGVPGAARGAGGVYHPAAADPRVELELSAAAAWLVEHYPCERVEALDGGRLRVVLAVSARAWLERLLVRLGTDAVVLHADEPLSVDVGRDAAERILQRYRH